MLDIRTCGSFSSQLKTYQVMIFFAQGTELNKDVNKDKSFYFAY